MTKFNLIMTESENTKLTYLNSNTPIEIVQSITCELPEPWHRRKRFLLWYISPSKNTVFPWCLSFDSKKRLTATKSMTGNLITLTQLSDLIYKQDIESLINSKRYGIAVNLIACNDWVVVDFDKCIPETFLSVPHSSSTFQHKLFYSLTNVPAYREISASGKGVHIIFQYKGFHKFIKNKFIYKVSNNVEIFLGGKVNKLLILTGHTTHVSYGYPLALDTEYRKSRGKRNYCIRKPTSEDLLPFINLITEFEDVSQKSSCQESKKESPSDGLTKESSNSAPNNFSYYRQQLLSFSGPTNFPGPEMQPNYKSFLLEREKFINIIDKKDFGSDTYKSYSELDFAVFSSLKNLYPVIKAENMPAFIHMFVNYYQKHFPARENKANDYLFRTCYKVISKSLENQQEYFSNQQTQENTPSCLVKTPHGMLFEVLESTPSYVYVENRQGLENFDWDVYNYLMELIVRNSSYSKNEFRTLATIKSSIDCSVGQIARFITRTNKVPGRFYTKVLTSLSRLAATRMTWKTEANEGAVTLLEYLYRRDNGALQITFTNLIAWVLLVDTKTLKNSPFGYSVYYADIFNLYKTSKQRQFYRYIITNSAVQGSPRTVFIDSTLLSHFYPVYTSRRHSFHKTSFLKLVEDFAQVQNSDIDLYFDDKKIVFSRKNVKSKSL